MSTVTFTESITFTCITCCAAGCGLTFGVPDHWETKRRQDHTTFYCPNGHPQSFRAKSEAELLRERLAREESNAAYWRDQHAAAEKGKIALKGQLTKTKKRLANGVCPCCKRSFTDSGLARHIKSKHPEYLDE